MQLIRRLTILLALALAVSTLPAQDEAGEDAAPGGSDAPAEPAPGDAADDAEGDNAEGDDAEGDDDEDAPDAGEDEVFVPTEELSAEDEVTFPVDI